MYIYIYNIYPCTLYIYISACTSSITALHVFYRCLGYHTPITLLYTYNTCIKSICISCAQSFTVILKLPPKILFLDRTLVIMYLCQVNAPLGSSSVHTVLHFTPCIPGDISSHLMHADIVLRTHIVHICPKQNPNLA